MQLNFTVLIKILFKMKNKLFIVLILLNSFLFISCEDAEQSNQNEQVDYEFKEYNGNVFLKTQAEVVEFGSNNYTKISGYLRIGDYLSNSDINDLSSLLSINTITGTENPNDESLDIVKNDYLVDLYGLNNLSTLYGMIAISDNHNLKNIDALSSLSGVIESITYSAGLYIHNNPNLENLNGLINVTGMGSLLIIRENTKLIDLDGLNNITSEFLEVEIRNNFQLTNLDALSNSTFNNYYIAITDNVHLNDFCGIYQISNSADDTFHAYGNAYNPTVNDIISGNCSQ